MFGDWETQFVIHQLSGVGVPAFVAPKSFVLIGFSNPQSRGCRVIDVPGEICSNLPEAQLIAHIGNPSVCMTTEFLHVLWSWKLFPAECRAQ